MLGKGADCHEKKIGMNTPNTEQHSVFHFDGWCSVYLNEWMGLYARVNRHVPTVEAFELKNLATIWFECCKVNMQTILLSQLENATVPPMLLIMILMHTPPKYRLPEWKDNDNTL